MTSRAPDDRRTVGGGRAVPALLCALAGAALFQFLGNSTHGYIDTSSLFYWWGYQWWNPSSETQHGWLILAVAVALAVRNLRREPPGGGSGAAQPDRWLGAAAAAFAVALGLHAVGFAVQQARISLVALLLYGWGVAVLGGGRRGGRALTFPLAFMVFAFPFNALDSVGFWLRLGVTEASAALAHAAGIGVLRSGTQLVAPDGRYQYDVAAACSGVRSLMALAALSLLVGYLTFRPWWLRALMLLLCVPFTYLGNLARISAIIFAAQAGGPKWGDYAHEAMGYGVFLIVLGGMMAAAAALRRRVPPAWLVEEDAPEAAANVAEAVRGAETWPAPTRASGQFLLTAAVLALALGEAAALAHLGAEPLRGGSGVRLAPDGLNPVDLPAFLGTAWIGQPAEVTAAEREILPPDTGFSRRTYVALGHPAQQVFLSIVLSGRDRTSIHRPELCLVGQGWTIERGRVGQFAEGGWRFPATILQVRREVMTAQGRRVLPQVVAYWFVSSDTIVATNGARLLHDAWNRLRHLRADRWAYVLLQTDAADGVDAALARMQAVLDRALPSFQKPPPPSGRG